jgi:3-oxoacyl-[acyl-carrier protein] reductase
VHHAHNLSKALLFTQRSPASLFRQGADVTAGTGEALSRRGGPSSRVALVSDGSGDIGAATVRRLAWAGWDVGFSYRCDEQSARRLEKAASELGVRVLATRTDLAGAAEVISWVGRAEEELGPAEAMVICAGIARDRPLTRMAEADWRAVIGTTPESLHDLVHAALAAMAGRRSGRIVAVSSVFRAYDHVPPRDRPAVFGSRPGIAALIRALADRAGRSGIRVNAVVPGLAEHGVDLTAILPGGTRAAVTETVALRRFGQAAEVADLVMFLLSEEAAALTGRVLAVTNSLALSRHHFVIFPGKPGCWMRRHVIREDQRKGAIYRDKVFPSFRLPRRGRPYRRRRGRRKRRDRQRRGHRIVQRGRLRCPLHRRGKGEPPRQDHAHRDVEPGPDRVRGLGHDLHEGQHEQDLFRKRRRHDPAQPHALALAVPR